MDSLTLELFRTLQSGPYDEPGLTRIRGLLRTQRRALRAHNDLATLNEIIELLTCWAVAACDVRLGAIAFREAADIAQYELRQPSLAKELRTRAVAEGNGGDQASVVVSAYTALGKRRSEAGDLNGAIDAYERALDVQPDIDIVLRLAELFALRSAPGDAEQSADLYCTVGELLGNPKGIVMLERALVQVPSHAPAKMLLGQYLLPGHTEPKRTLLGMPSPTFELTGPLLANLAEPSSSASAPTAPRLKPPAISFQPHASTQPASATDRARPLLSSLTPVVVDDKSVPRRKPSAPRKRWAIGATAVAGMAAALSVFFMPRHEDARDDARGLSPTRGESVKALPRSAAPESTQRMAAAQPSAATRAGAGGPATPIPTPEAKPSKPETAASAPIVAPAGSAVSAPASPSTPAAVSGESDESPSATAAAEPSPSAVQPMFKFATLRGGKLSEPQLTAAIDKVAPKLERCYAETLRKRPHSAGRLTFSWTVRPSGHVTRVKKVSGTIDDATLTRCTTQALETTHFPKLPHKQSVQVKLPLEYRRS
jgi:hypothetical protein